MTAVPEEGDQTDNVTGPTRYGITEELPSKIDLARMVAYFRNLARWQEYHPLLPNEIRKHVEDRPGVYMLWLNPPRPPSRGGNVTRIDRIQSRVGNVEVINHSTRLAYIGESAHLNVRLGGYALALNPDRPPVYQVVRDRVMGRPQLAHDYLISAPSGMRALRRKWMKERNLCFQVAYTGTKFDARQLQDTMTRYCHHHGLTLWNTKLGTSGVTWPPHGPKTMYMGSPPNNVYDVKIGDYWVDHSGGPDNPDDDKAWDNYKDPSYRWDGRKWIPTPLPEY